MAFEKYQELAEATGQTIKISVDGKTCDLYDSTGVIAIKTGWDPWAIASDFRTVVKKISYDQLKKVYMQLPIETDLTVISWDEVQKLLSGVMEVVYKSMTDKYEVIR